MKRNKPLVVNRRKRKHRYYRDSGERLWLLVVPQSLVGTATTVKLGDLPPMVRKTGPAWLLPVTVVRYEFDRPQSGSAFLLWGAGDVEARLWREGSWWGRDRWVVFERDARCPTGPDCRYGQGGWRVGLGVGVFVRQHQEGRCLGAGEGPGRWYRREMVRF